MKVRTTPILIALAAILALIAPARAQETPRRDPPTSETPPRSTPAERLVRIRTLLESDRARQAQLQREHETLNAEFQAVFDELMRRNRAMSEARRANENIAELETQLAASRSNLNRIVDHRRAVRRQLETLAEKIPLEEDMLQGLIEGRSRVLAESGDKPAQSPGPSDTQGAAQAPAAAAPAPPAPNRLFGPIARSDAAAGDDPATSEVERFDERIIAAKERFEDRRRRLDRATRSVERLDRAIDVFERDLEAAREHTHGGEEVQRDGEHLRDTEDAVDNLRAARARAVERVADAERDVRAAERELSFLQGPFGPRRLQHWFTTSAPKVLVIILGMVTLWWIARLIGRRIVVEVVKRGLRGSDVEREGRAETLRRIFQSAAGVTVIVLGTLAALHAAGIDVTVLLGGAAVIGAAFAFGSQNLIKDYFAGFMILVENQYNVGNVIKVGDITGTVEDVSMRVTVIRDLEGVVHFVPHSTVLRVSNLTFGWSRLVFDIKVAPDQDPDRVMSVLMDVARSLSADPEFGPQLAGDPEMLGVDSLAAAATSIKFLVKTRALNRWRIKREMLRRIKKAFDKEGIKMA